LAAALDRAFGAALTSAPVAGLSVTFDDDASPWYTLADVRGPDQPGLLQTLATAFAAAGVNVHSALVTTVEGEARDRFELTDRSGNKLDQAAKDAIRAALAGGVSVPRRMRRRFTSRKHSVTETKPSGHDRETSVT
jgi:UTP:GlnB (protein PII) uridylyltransferase